jgi:hypothetical protein
LISAKDAECCAGATEFQEAAEKDAPLLDIGGERWFDASREANSIAVAAVALAHGDLLFAAFWRCHRNDGVRRRLARGALAMRKVAVYIAFVLSTAWLLVGSWQLPQTVSGASREATNDYWQDAPRAPMTDEGKTEAKVSRAEGEQLSKEE